MENKEDGEAKRENSSTIEADDPALSLSMDYFLDEQEEKTCAVAVHEMSASEGESAAETGIGAAAASTVGSSAAGLQQQSPAHVHVGGLTCWGQESPSQAGEVDVLDCEEGEIWNNNLPSHPSPLKRDGAAPAAGEQSTKTSVTIEWALIQMYVADGRDPPDWLLRIATPPDTAMNTVRSSTVQPASSFRSNSSTGVQTHSRHMNFKFS